MQVESVTPVQLVSELTEGNPPPEEKWFQRDDFDPTYSMTELRSAARKGWIELDTSSGDPETYRFRLTALGRKAARC